MKFDRIILLIISLLAIGLSVLMILKSRSLPDQYVQNRPAKDDTTTDPGIEATNTTASQLDKKFVWERPVVDTGDAAIRVPLNKSIPIIEKEGQTFDMLKPEPKLRPPMQNQWLLDNKLQFRRPDVADLDPDDDGFSNIEEFNGRTNPKDEGSHPPFTQKLFLKEVISVPYILKFSGIIDPEFQVQRLKPDPRKTWFVPVGTPFGTEEHDGLKNRFEIKGMTEKSMEDGGLTRNVSELEITDHLWGEPIVLVYKQEQDFPTLFASFEYRRQAAADFQVKKGSTFKLPKEDETTYKLIDVNESQALISRLEESGEWGAEIAIPFEAAKAPAPAEESIDLEDGSAPPEENLESSPDEVEAEPVEEPSVPAVP